MDEGQVRKGIGNEIAVRFETSTKVLAKCLQKYYISQSGRRQHANSYKHKV